MRRVMVSVVLMCMVQLLCGGVYSGGIGTAEDPWLIANLADLQEMCQSGEDWGGSDDYENHFYQTADIDASQTAYWDDSDDNGDGDKYNDANDLTSAGSNDGWPGIGNAWGWNTWFASHYHGCGYAVDGITINRSTTYVGFFGLTYNQASIRDLDLTNVDITGGDSVGALAGQTNGGDLINCSSSGIVRGGGKVGGLVGRHDASGVTQNCFSSCTVTGTSTSVGGLVGYSQSPQISECYSTGDVVGNGMMVGGFAGRIVSGTVQDSYHIGDVYNNSAHPYTGSFHGSYESTFTNCYTLGSVYYPNGTDPSNKGFSNGGTNSRNYWDSEISNQLSATGATAKTSLEMQTQDTYTGWDFDSVWMLNPSINDGYPYLKAVQPESPLPVTLSSFAGALNEDCPELQWTTQSETGNMGWNVFRNQLDELDTAALLTQSLIPGAGTSSVCTEYSYLDASPVVAGKSYCYWIQSVSADGMVETYGPVSVDIPLGQSEPYSPDVPSGSCVQNYPNPFNPSTLICLTLAESDCAAATVKIYNSRGQMVRRLEAPRTAGDAATFSAVWDGCDAAGKTVSSGVYLARIQAGTHQMLHKMVMMK